MQLIRLVMVVSDLILAMRGLTLPWSRTG